MNVYNCRVYSYETGQHVTFYKRAITQGKEELLEDVEDDTGSDTASDYTSDRSPVDQIEERSAEAEEHSKKSSCSRSKNQVYRIARSNVWDWFVTITFDRTRTDASDYDSVVEKLQNFLENTRQRKCPDMQYLIVPELHADKKHYHFHGLLANADGLRFAYSGLDDRKSGRCIYNILDWAWGFTTATRVGDSSRTSSYITKYITKDVDLHLKDKRRYYYSQNCNIAEKELYLMDEENFLLVYADRIKYTKSVVVPQANQIINYYELDW